MMVKCYKKLISSPICKIFFNMDGYTIHIMLNGSVKLSRSKKIAYTSLMIALAVALRLIKYSLFGNLQFVNFPGIFTIVSGIFFGPVTGTVVGFSSYLLSDMLIGMPGPWTVVNMLFMGSLGMLSGLLWNRKNRSGISKFGVGIGTYIMMLGFDIMTSVLLLVVMQYPLQLAFITGILGLFVPVGGGYMYAIGPVTELTTAILVVAIAHALLNRNGIRVAKV